MFFIYKILINLVFFFSPLIIIFRLFKGKEDQLRFKEKIGFFSKKRNKGNLIWFHGASVGEIQSIIPYSISILKENSTRWKIIFAASAGNVPLLEISSGTGVVETLQEGVDLSGTFTLRYLDAFTTAISFNANADEVESKLNAILPSFRTVKVQKLSTVNTNQHDWSVTFPSEMGNVPMLIGDPNWLKGDGKSVIVTEQVKGGTTLVGSFRLGIDANTFTTALRPDATAMEVKEAIITLK